MAVKYALTARPLSISIRDPLKMRACERVIIVSLYRPQLKQAAKGSWWGSISAIIVMVLLFVVMSELGTVRFNVYGPWLELWEEVFRSPSSTRNFWCVMGLWSHFHFVIFNYHQERRNWRLRTWEYFKKGRQSWRRARDCLQKINRKQ